MTTIQIRIDEKTKKEATILFERLGLDLSTAIRMFLNRSICVGGLPFPSLLDKDEQERFGQIIKELNDEAKRNGVSEMTLDEINEEIRLARKERRERNKNN